MTFFNHITVILDLMSSADFDAQAWMSGRNIALGSFTNDGVKFLMERLGLARFLRSSECRKSTNVQTPGEKWTLHLC